ncbi:protein translocase subunit SecD, partial [Bacteroides fragilis]|nr:protein translocase subunit SecD [Bacteroides fragilis]
QGATPVGSATSITGDFSQEEASSLANNLKYGAPVIQGATPVGSATSITGDFSQEEASSLANNLKYGA